jgi:GT2 family glycosyltransferase
MHSVPATTPDLSICIVNWNCADHLRNLLNSIRRKADDLSVEIIVVDNASTDHSVAMIEAEFPDVRLIRNGRHQGIARANNQAAALAQAELILFLNNDTVIAPGALEKLVSFFQGHPEFSALAPSLTYPDGQRQGNVRASLGFPALLHRVTLLRWTGIFRAADRQYRQVDFNLRQSAAVEYLVGAALLLRRKQFAAIGGWDENFEFRLDDIDLSARLRRFGRMYYLADAQVTHWGGVATELDEPYAYRCSETSCVHYLRKHHGPWRARVYKALISADMPARIFVLTLTWAAKRLFGERERAARNYRKLAAAGRFLGDLPLYWRS